MSRGSTIILMVMLGISIVGFFILNLLLGSVSIPVDNIIDILLGRDNDNLIWRNIILKSRLPQSLTAMMAGAGLAVSGLLMQTVFRNPLADPHIMGVSAGASLAAAFVTAALPSALNTGALSGLSLAAAAFLPPPPLRC